MGTEIERKFLVDRLPGPLDGLTAMAIRQGYLIATENGTELRIRQNVERFYQTIKMGEGLSRTEIEVELSKHQFDSLWPHTSGRRVSKTRYAVPLEDHVAELDIFDGILTGLRLVEVEFPDVDASRAFSPPEWFGKEVTMDKRYKNRQLALHGIPKE